MPLNDKMLSPGDLDSLPLKPPLPFPDGQTEASITSLFTSFELEGAPKEELQSYWHQDWKRFIYTYGLASGLTGRCLELGANPYFTTLLLKYFTRLDLTLANYFGPQLAPRSAQKVAAANPQSGTLETHLFEFEHFNLEEAQFPFNPHSFDLVLLCEVIEHLQIDPVKVLLEIKHVLKPGGHLVLTTPNVSRLENVCRMAAGSNIYDPYSGYGPYGRHNREYNKHELALLLDYCGFDLEVLFSADVHENISSNIFPVEQILPLVRFREHDLGQYLFSRSRNCRAAGSKRPGWLYRSYPAADLEP